MKNKNIIINTYLTIKEANMYKKVITAIIILLCLGFISCGEANKPIDIDDPIVHVTDSSDEDDFFPLRVGDKFLYRLSPESIDAHFLKKEVEMRVTRKVDTLGKTYYVIENYFAVGSGLEGIIYARKDGHNVYFFAPDEEVLFYRFDPSDDEKYTIPIGILTNGRWSRVNDYYVIKKFDSGENHFTFFIQDRFKGHLSSYNHYSRFERGKGRTQVYSQGDLGPIVYDLVNVYR